MIMQEILFCFQKKMWPFTKYDQYYSNGDNGETLHTF